MANHAALDWEARMCTTPAERLRAGKGHRVPFSHHCLEILDEAESHADGGRHVSGPLPTAPSLGYGLPDAAPRGWPPLLTRPSRICSTPPSACPSGSSHRTALIGAGRRPDDPGFTRPKPSRLPTHGSADRYTCRPLKENSAIPPMACTPGVHLVSQDVPASCSQYRSIGMDGRS